MEEHTMRTHLISGGGGVQLHVVETGNATGRPIVFVHGLSQCWLSWSRQMNSDLADTFRLVAIDLRGHGLSDKPREGYTDSKLWADDLHAVIQALGLDHPLLCGWSYGPLVMLDYVRHYGEDNIGGLNFVGGVTKLGSEEAAAVLSQGFIALLPGFFSTDAEESARALGSLLSMCFVGELTAEERYLMLGYNLSVPPYVRQALLSRALDNDDLLPRIRKPVLITHGARDAVVKAAVIDQQMKRIPNARIQIMANAGHGCCWEEAPAYNRNLREFVSSL
jgi:pimeloyl-ACP methyl ester carboxylesterase